MQTSRRNREKQREEGLGEVTEAGRHTHTHTHTHHPQGNKAGLRRPSHPGHPASATCLVPDALTQPASDPNRHSCLHHHYHHRPPRAPAPEPVSRGGKGTTDPPPPMQRAWPPLPPHPFSLCSALLGLCGCSLPLSVSLIPTLIAESSLHPSPCWPGQLRALASPLTGPAQLYLPVLQRGRHSERQG